MKAQHLVLGAGALSLAALAPAAAAAADKPGSAYVQCDGQPNNVTGGETAARLLGAITLLGLFAPPPEAPDASKRKFGAEGVAVCTTLIEGEKREGNAERRFGLILGRAIHRIEAKDYTGAKADVALARQEAQAAGLLANPYFARSRGRALDLVESAALVREGKADEARSASLRHADAYQYSVFALFGTPTYDDLLPAPSPEEDRALGWEARLLPSAVLRRAERMELAGRFAEAARMRDAFIDYDTGDSPELNSSSPMAAAAVDYALAGDMTTAAERAKAARANAEQRKVAGKPESDVAEFVEIMDLYDLIETAARGDAKTARRLFAARSQWVGASLGSVMEVNRRLRVGAAADELIGGLAKTPEQIWAERADTARAAMLAKDSDNKTLFALVPRLLPANAFEPLSKRVWDTQKSKILIKSKADSTSKMEALFLPFVDPEVAMDAYVLHAALLAKSRGQQGFVFTPLVTKELTAALIRTGNRGDKGFPADLFVPADEVIAKLSPVFPDPAALAARRAVR